MAHGAAAFAAARCVRGAEGSLGQRPNVPEAVKIPINIYAFNPSSIVVLFPYMWECCDKGLSPVTREGINEGIKSVKNLLKM